MPLFSPVSAGGVGKATVTATTGSPNIDSSTRAGKTIYKFNSSGSITIGTAGTAEVLVVGGGGGSRPNGAPGAGAGGYIYKSSYYIPAGTYDVTVGAGGVGRAYDFYGPNNNGEDSVFADLRAIGGGGASNIDGGASWTIRGGSGGGGTYNIGPGAGITGQGFGGGSGSGSTYQPGGGGGAGGVGGNGGASPGVGGIGVANSITGTSVTYAIGGVQGSGTVAANRGLGGGGRGPSTSPELCTGGSGVVIIVIG